MPRFGLRVKLFIAFGIVLLPVLVLLIMGFQANLAWRESLILDDQRLTAEAVAVQVDGAFDASIGMGWAVANDPLTQTFDSKLLDSHLKQLMARYPFYHAIHVFDSKGMNHGFGHLTLSSEPRFNIADRSHFQTVMATNTPVISPVLQISRPMGVIGIVAVVPIRNEAGQAIGVVSVVMTAEQLAKRYEETRLLPGQAIVLVDRDAHIAFHSLRRNLSYTAISAFKDLPPLRAALAGIPTTVNEFSDPVTKDLRLGAFVPTKRYRWAVGVTMPPSVALAPVYGLLRQQLAVFAGILILSAVLASMLARYLVQPFLRLNAAARALGRGDLSRRVEIHTGDEIEHLGASFNEMAGQLEEREKALRDREARIRRLVESNIIGIFFWDLDGSISDANDAFLRMVGYTRDELLFEGMCWLDMTPQEYRVVDEQAIDDLQRVGSFKPYDKELIRKDGGHISVLLGGAFFEGSRENGVAFVLDLTERKQAEIELKRHRDHLDELVRERTAELIVAKDVAEEATRTQSMFLANMSHEIRTPMNAIIGLSHLALKAVVDTKQHDYLTKIHGAGTSLLRIINDILDFSKIEAHKLDIENIPFKLHQVTENVETMVGHAATEKGLKLVIDMDADVPQALVGDPLRLAQILTNLVSNAVKFTEQGEVTVHIQYMECSAESVQLQFDVRDTGIGMTPEQQKHLFQAFTQADGSTTRKYGGTGLGLAISKRLVELMHGAIKVQSKPGLGSTFSVTIDFDRVQSMPDILEYKQSDAQYSLEKLQGLKVLLAEDNSINQQIAVELMSGVGVVVDVADNGRIAVEKLTSGKVYDIVLMDLHMPEMDGYAATITIRAHDNFKTLPIIALTAHAMIEQRQRCLDIGMNDHVAKPIDPIILFEALARWSPIEVSGTRKDNLFAESPVADASSLFLITGVDTAGALRRVGGNTALYKKLLNQFVVEQDEAAEQIQLLLAVGDRTSARRVAHTIKGVASNMGAMALAEVAGQLERAIQHLHEDSVLLERFTQTLAATLDAIQQALPSEATPLPTMVGALNASENPTEIMRQLAHYLLVMDDQALDYFALHHSELTQVLGPHAKAIEQAMNEFDLKSALDRLKEAAEQLGVQLNV